MSRLVALLGPSFPHVEAGDLSDRLGAPDAPLILDVRSPAEYAQGHIPGAINVPHDQVAAHAAELASRGGRGVVIYCLSGMRAAAAAGALQRAGMTDIRLLSGHMQGWRAARRPVHP